jgi:hypothetical protein
MGTAVGNITKILSDIESAVSSLSSQADSLINRAESALKDSTQFPNPGVVVTTLTDFVPTYSIGGEVAGMPVIPEPELPQPPNYRASGIPSYRDTGIGNAPVITPFTPSPMAPADPVNPPPRPDMTDPGNTDGSFTLPALPSFAPNFTPRYLSITQGLQRELSLSLPPIDLLDMDVDLTIPDYTDVEDQFKGYIYNGVMGIPGFNELSAGLNQFSDQVFQQLSHVVLQELADRFAAPQATVNALKEAKLQALFTAQEQALRQQQAQELAHITDQAGWELPTAVRDAMQQQATQWLNAWVAQAQAQRSTQIMEHAQKLFEFCSELYGKLREAVENFRVEEIKAVLDAHREAILYAKQKTGILLKLFDLEHYRQYDLDLQRAEALLAQFELQLSLDMARYEFVRTQIELEQLNQNQDGNLIAQYAAEADALKARTEAVNQQMQALNKEIDAKKNGIEVFRAKVQRFSALADAESANLGRMQSLIEGNNLNREAELAKLVGYETEISAFEQMFDAKDDVTSNTIATNRAKLDAFDGMTKAAAVPVEYSLLRAQLGLYAHEINANNYLQDAELAMNFKKMDLEFMKQKRELRDELLRDFQEMALDMAEAEVGRKQAVAEVAIQCANVLASMAEGAMSAGNLVASATIEELA